MNTKPLLLLLLTCILNYAAASVRTVSNTPTSTIAQFSTINAAISASLNGDTIYVHGSANAYSGFSITNKKITIIGPGWSPDKANAFAAVINSSSSVSGTASTGSEIHGLYFTSALSINSNIPDSIRIIRNRFSNTSVNVNAGNVTYRNYVFEGNYFDNNFCCDPIVVDASTNSVYSQFVFQNNIFFSRNANADGASGGRINGFNAATNSVLFDHNVFYGPQSTSLATNAFTNCGFIIFSNNIFFKRNVSVSNSFFNNNLTFNTQTNTAWIGNNNTDSGGNLPDTDPLMADEANFTNSPNNNPLHNFSIAAGPANNAGSDGKDIGVLFDSTGSLNWNNSRNSRLPRIFSMNISSPVNPAGGSINVTVEGRKSN